MSYADWRERLGEASDPAFFPIEFMDHLVVTGQGQFWGADNAAMVTWLRTYPGGARTCETYAAAGDMQAILTQLKPAIERWAMEQGLTHCLITSSREGWSKKHPDYTHFQTILYKELP